MKDADLAKFETRIGSCIVLAASIAIITIAVVVGLLIGGSP